MPMSDDWTKEIRERLEKATPGPWASYEGLVCKITGYSSKRKQPRLKCIHEAEDYDSEGYFSDEDADLIAHAPTDIANLLKEREVLREALVKLDEALHWKGWEISNIARDVLAWKPEEK